ncbi:M61 family metallopeptidase [Caulobacter endophyticus]|uniref:M61 family metallopeptidase n=1 Tax=Caulobacter endophyticus TaxID=2172652 RepID=UPI00240EE495|nr:peptidase M61 [Caulobacter endophyticus]MDG2529442.1 peptidase M61 [Caulobacter endophyticus]
MKALFFSVSLLSLVGGAALAQDYLPQPAAPTPPIVAPQDVAYPGVLKLYVDATDLERKIFDIKLTLPVAKPGPMTLYYPQWVPGGHSPRNDIDKLAGLVITANGQTIPWKRDVVEVNAFHIDVPAGVTELSVAYKFLSPVETKVGRMVMTPDMLNLQWLQMTMYPAGHFTRRITVEPTVKLPEGFQFASALEVDKTQGQVTSFKPTTVETLVDSPMFAGRYFKSVELDPGGKVPVRLNMIADKPELLEYKPEQLQAHKNLVQQAYKLYGSHHYDHYDFLVALSDQLGGIGLEHHQSSENRVAPKYFTDWDKSYVGRDLLPHEFTHSWNGKFRRGADLWTPTLNTPMRDSLMWVYEGQTQYWGYVLSSRSGLLTKEQTLDSIAMTAALYDNRRGRDWRPVQDTTNDPIIASRKPLSWLSFQRSEDYYSEGQLVWLDADTLIREKTGGKKSLDDFAKAFFGVADGSYVSHTYTFDDVVAALNGVVPYDWATFLKDRIEGVNPKAPLDGLTRGGYKLVYTDTPTDYFKVSETRGKNTNLAYSIGLTVGSDAVLTDVQWDGPAFKAGLTQGLTVVAVNGDTYDAEKLKAAVKATAKGVPVELLVKEGSRYRTVKLDYSGGLRYPRLERIAGTPARLDDILAARK